ncbi:YSIRK-type signal peptide-containing protein, partial [Enterococcus faecalis]|nr:YSIRK-type signal peptide-containing protein [Enterococcus faecalis]
MFSKKNVNMFLLRTEKKIQKYSIKKTSVGVASILVGILFFLGSSSVVFGEELGDKTISPNNVVLTEHNKTNCNSQQDRKEELVNTKNTVKEYEDNNTDNENILSGVRSSSNVSNNLNESIENNIFLKASPTLK